MDEHLGGKARDEEPEGRRQPSLLLMPGKLTEVVSKMMLVLKKKQLCRFEKNVGFFSFNRIRNQSKTTLTLRM